MEEQITQKAIEATLNAKAAYCKFLSANDSGETGGHQVGILISKSARSMMFTENELKDNHILKKDVHVKWQDDFSTDSCFTWYESKNELRITRFGKGFPLLEPEYTGALFVLVRETFENYEAFVLNTEDNIQQYLDAFSLSPADTNHLVGINQVSPEITEKLAISDFVSTLHTGFPSSDEMSAAARFIQYKVKKNQSLIVTNPDRIIIDWTEEEYRLFRAIEHSQYGDTVSTGFKSVEDFVVLANQILNRRKSRAGKSLEHHLAAVFDGNHLRYTAQGVTEGNKKPDFVFPSIEDYHNSLFSIDRLCTLAAKTTCKDRWRQVLNEADRLRDQNKYLCTLQQGISSAQMDEMQAERVILVVPKPYISTYPHDRQERIWTISRFIQHVKELEAL